MTDLPTPEGRYVLTRDRKAKAGPRKRPHWHAEALALWMGSDKSQAAVAAGGFADLAPGRASDNYGADRLDSVRNAQDGGRLRIRTGDARAFEEATAGANRLSITFRFQASTNNLDTRAEQDVQRLADLLKLPGFAKQQVVLIGFSSANGDYGENRILSKERAEAIRDRLVNVHGIKDVMCLGIGPAGAVACNLDANTASLNQRVEVWLRRAPAG